ncbi:MAG: hypothetical protein GC131_08060 [Alphaproteobacteria bacterium]|nr:hypothetical protein [Alphaproteobacteria bacterium]
MKLSDFLAKKPDKAPATKKDKGGNAKKGPSILEGLSADMVQRALMSLDRAALVIVGSTWGAAMVMVAIALYTVSLAKDASADLDMALAAEPSLPRLEQTSMEFEDTNKIVERLKKRYEGIVYETGKNGELLIKATNADSFSTWMASLSYLDTVAPDVRWSLAAMCIGAECQENHLMAATILGRRISYKPAE